VKGVPVPVSVWDWDWDWACVWVLLSGFDSAPRGVCFIACQIIVMIAMSRLFSCCD